MILISKSFLFFFWLKVVRLILRKKKRKKLQAHGKAWSNTLALYHKSHKDNTKPMIGHGITYFIFFCYLIFLFVYSPNLIALIKLITPTYNNNKLRGSHNHENIEQKLI